MKCPNCNAEIPNGSTFCPVCGASISSQPQFNQPQGYPQGVAGDKPNNNLVWAILSTVLCCLPTGIYAIILSTKVDSLWNSGQYDEAKLKAEEAKKWSMIVAGIGIVVSILYGIVMCAGAMAE